MRGLDPRIHLLRKIPAKQMDGRVKPGHDEKSIDVLSRLVQARLPSPPGAVLGTWVANKAPG
jgi:hypothetical protein